MRFRILAQVKVNDQHTSKRSAVSAQQYPITSERYIYFVHSTKNNSSCRSAGKSIKLDGQGRARREAARRRKSECKVNLDILNSSRSSASKRLQKHVAYVLASAYSVRALRVCQYARNNFFCLWAKVHHVIHVPTVKVW